MAMAFSVGRVAGIDTQIHATLLLFMGWIGFEAWQRDHSTAGALLAVLFFSLVLVSVLAHELGHALAARRYGIRTRKIMLSPLGGVAQLERLPQRPRQEFVIALAGPVVSVLLGWALGELVPLCPAGPAKTVLQLSRANYMLGVFNLLPAFPMDGGRVLRAALALRLPYLKATRMAASLGRLIAVVFIVIGALYNPMLSVIGLFVFVAAGHEARVVAHTIAMRAMRARQARHHYGGVSLPTVEVPSWSRARGVTRDGRDRLERLTPEELLQRLGSPLWWLRRW